MIMRYLSCFLDKYSVDVLLMKGCYIQNIRSTQPTFYYNHDKSLFDTRYSAYKLTQRLNYYLSGLMNNVGLPPLSRQAGYRITHCASAC